MKHIFEYLFSKKSDLDKLNTFSKDDIKEYDVLIDRDKTIWVVYYDEVWDWDTDRQIKCLNLKKYFDNPITHSGTVHNQIPLSYWNKKLEYAPNFAEKQPNLDIVEVLRPKNIKSFRYKYGLYFDLEKQYKQNNRNLELIWKR